MSFLDRAPNLDTVRVLVVDDDEDDFVFIRDLLKALDPAVAEVKWASTFADGLEAIRNARPDVVLVDYRLGTRTGVELIEQAGLRDSGPPSIMLTGVGEREADDRAMRAGAHDFLRKGEISPAILERSIRYAIDGHRREEAHRFLSNATHVFNTSLEYDTTVGAAARIVVPTLADWSCIYLPSDIETFEHVEIAHSDPERDDAARRMADLLSMSGSALSVHRVLEGEKAVVLRSMTDENLQAWLEEPERYELVEELGAASAVAIQLPGKVSLLGVLVLVSTNGDRVYRDEDAPFFIELGQRVGMAVENARLFETVREATNMRDEVMGMVSHDLGNPLAAISLAVGRIEHHLEEDQNETIARYAEMIRSSAESMERLLDDLLQVGLLESGHFSFRRMPEEVHDILESAYKRFAPHADARGIELELEPPGPMPEVRVDLDRVFQVLSNLLGNALKFTESGGRVRMGAALVDGEVRFTVADTGPGMSEEEMVHLFDRFWQARRHRRVGAGLGLTISREIVEAHDGRIWAESEEGVGSTFHFTVPTVENDGS